MVPSRRTAVIIGVFLLTVVALAPTASRASSLATITLTSTPTSALTPAATVTPMSTVTVPLSLDGLAHALRLPSSTFASARIDPQFDRVEVNATADGDAFATDHSASFEQLGRYSGYFEQAEYQPKGSAETAVYQYQASIYGSDAAAAAAWNDGVHTVQEYSGGGIDRCADNSCATIWASKLEGQNRIVYFSAYARYCVAEAQESIPAAILAGAGGGLTLIASIHDAARQAIGQLCTEPPPAAPAPTPTTEPYPASISIPALTPIPVFSPVASCPTSGLAGIQISACVSDVMPTDRERVTVFASITNDGQPLANVPMLATWNYKTFASYCTGVTDPSGVASCAEDIGQAAIGYTVDVTVTFTYNGQPYSVVTSFTPQAG